MRWTAVAGTSMIPTLRAMARPEMNFNSPPGEAQISLAKLGDEAALRELDQELNHAPEGGYAVEKLAHVGTDPAIALLAAFLRAHISDISLVHRYSSDTEVDLRGRMVAGMSALAVDWPTEVDTAHPYKVWLDWWDQRKGKVALSISDDVRDPVLACLARKVEWGFPDAIFDMANTGNPQAIPILKKLEHVGPTNSGRDSIRGRARFALAELGDEEAFQIYEKDMLHYGGDTDSLRQIGGRRAVDALVRALDSNFPREPHGVSVQPSPADKKNYDEYQKNAAQYKLRTDEEIIGALETMVTDPPHLIGDLENRKKQWKDWWAKNKDVAKFVKPPARQHE